MSQPNKKKKHKFRYTNKIKKYKSYQRMDLRRHYLWKQRMSLITNYRIHKTPSNNRSKAIDKNKVNRTDKSQKEA